MTVKTPIRTVFDNDGNATGLAEFQTGERVGISHGGTGLASVGTAGQVLAVNANTDGLEFTDQGGITSLTHTTANDTLTIVSADGTRKVQIGTDKVDALSSDPQSMVANLAIDSTGSTSGVHIANGAISIYSATGNPSYVDFYCEVTNAHYTRFQAAAHADYTGNVTLTSPTTSGTIGLDADIKDRMQVANTTTLVNDRMQVANTQSLHTNITANLNSYIANTNPRITNILTSVSGTNTAIRTLVSDRMQVANTQALHTSVTANLNSYIANTNPRIASNDTDISNLLTSVSGTNTAIRALVTTESGRIDNVLTSISGTNTSIRTLVSDRMQVANTIALANARLGAAATITLTGDVTASATAFSSNAASISTTIASNSVDGSKLADNITIAENLVVSGNLTVSGTQTTVNSNEVNIGDAILTLNSDLGSGVAASEDAGISINRGSDADVSFIYDESEDRWSLGSQQLVSGDLIPNSDSAEDLGTTSVRWRKLFTDAIDITNDVDVGGNLTVTGSINATVEGQANTAAALSTARAIQLGGDLSGSANFDGTSDITITATIQNNSVALGTDTTGNYVGTITGGTGIASSGATSGEGIAHTLSVDLSELTDMTAAMVGTDEFIVLDAGADRRKAASEIGLSIFNNDAGFSTTTGTVTSHTVGAGNGLTGGGTVTSSGTTTLNVGAGTGISVSADAVALATAGAGAGTYGSTDDGTKIDTITLDAYGRVTAVATGATMDRWILEDGDGTEVVINRDNEVKFVEGGGVDINWTDTDNGTDGDPYDLTFTVNSSVTAGNGLTGGGQLNASRTLNVGAGTGISVAADTVGLAADQRLAAATDVYVGNAHEFIHFDDGNQIMRFYVANAEDMRLENDGDLHVDGDVVSESTTVSSDEKLKENIEVVENAVEKIHQLRGVEFNWKKSGRKSAGVIAQDVEKVLPQAVKEVRSLAEDEDAYLTVKYDSLHALTIEAIKTMSDEIAALKEEIKILKGE